MKIPLLGPKSQTRMPDFDQNMFWSGEQRGAGTTAWTLTTWEAAAKSFATTNASGAVDAILPAGFTGTFYVNNTSGQTVTWKYAASTGVANATAKKSIMIADGTEVYSIKADY